MGNSIRISFPDVDPQQALLARDLSQEIQSANSAAHLELVASDPRDMFGAAELQIILDSGSVVAVAYGIHKWLSGLNKAHISIKKDGIEVSANNVSSGTSLKMVTEVVGSGADERGANE
jgi:hypothetical protein